MTVRLKKLSDQVVVITGASSGIGLVTARMAATRGAKLVLAARNGDALTRLADEIRQAGGEAVPVIADVGNEDDVRGVVRAAVARFGRFDTWINNAGVGIHGALLDVPTADFRRLFDTNFWGVVYGSLEAARHLRDTGGAIINIGSEVSDRSVPLMGMYAASKHAVKGFTDALRMELEKAGAPVVVTLVKPGATDTPFPDHSQTHLGQEPKLPSPMYAPETVAEVILHCCETPEREMFSGGSARMHSLQGGLMPRLMDWLMEAFFFDKQKSGRPADHSDDALYRPTTGLQERGSSEGQVRETSVTNRLAMHPLLTGALVVGAGLAAAALVGGVAAGSRRDGSRGGA